MVKQDSEHLLDRKCDPFQFTVDDRHRASVDRDRFDRLFKAGRSIGSGLTDD